MSKFRYLLFGSDYNYPSGGTDDLLFGFNTINELISKLNTIVKESDYIYEKYNLIDIVSMEKCSMYGYEKCSIYKLNSFNEEEFKDSLGIYLEFKKEFNSIIEDEDMTNEEVIYHKYMILSKFRLISCIKKYISGNFKQYSKEIN